MATFHIKCDCICGCDKPAISTHFRACMDCYTIIASYPNDTEHCKKTISATTKLKRIDQYLHTDGLYHSRYIIEELFSEVTFDGYVTKTTLWLTGPSDECEVQRLTETIDFGRMAESDQISVYSQHTRQGWVFEGWKDRQMIKVRDRLNRENRETWRLHVDKINNEAEKQKIKQILIENKGRKFDL